MHTSRRPPSSPPRPHNRKNGEGAAVPVCTSARRSFYLARGARGNAPSFYIRKLGYVFVFQRFMFHVEQPYIYFFLTLNKYKKKSTFVQSGRLHL